MNVEPSIVRKKNIEPLQLEVRHADIGLGNTHEEVAPTLMRHPVPQGEEQDACCAAPADATSTRLHAGNLHRLINWQCKFCNSRPDSVPSHSDAEFHLDEQFQRPKHDLLVILQRNVIGIIRDVAAQEIVLASLLVDIACIRETKLLPRDKTPEILQCRAVRSDSLIQGERGVEVTSSTYERY